MGFTLRKEGSDFFNELFYHLPKEAEFITFGTEDYSSWNKGFLRRFGTLLWKALQKISCGNKL